MKNFRILSILLMFCIQVHAGFYRHGGIVIEINDEIETRNQSIHGGARYNQLLDVEIAQEEFAKRDLEALLKEASEWICRNALHEVIGLRLLHKHNTLDSTSKMIEYFAMHDGSKKSLITAKCVEDKTTEVASLSAFPSIWAVSSAAETPIIALEYTSDPGGKVSYKTLLEREGFLERMRSIILKHEAEDLIGICTVRRDELTLLPGQIYFEYTDERDTENVLFVEEEEKVVPDSSIVTSWKFSPSAGTVATWGPKCRCIRVSVCRRPPRGLHVSVYTHNKC